VPTDNKGKVEDKQAKPAGGKSKNTPNTSEKKPTVEIKKKVDEQNTKPNAAKDRYVDSGKETHQKP
jgi:hypothetical protein